MVLRRTHVKHGRTIVALISITSFAENLSLFLFLSLQKWTDVYFYLLYTNDVINVTNVNKCQLAQSLITSTWSHPDSSHFSTSCSPLPLSPASQGLGSWYLFTCGQPLDQAVSGMSCTSLIFSPFLPSLWLTTEMARNLWEAEKYVNNPYSRREKANVVGNISTAQNHAWGTIHAWIVRTLWAVGWFLSLFILQKDLESPCKLLLKNLWRLRSIGREGRQGRFPGWNRDG